MSTPRLSAVLAILAMAGALAAQPVFEVASIKRSPEGPGGVSGGCHGTDSSPADLARDNFPQLGRCVISEARLSHLVNIAWGLGGMQLIQSRPDWIARGDERFDVVAKAEDPAHTSERQLLSMLQNLLVDRFQMKFHLEAVEERGMALTVDKDGPKLHESKSDTIQTVYGGGAEGGKVVRGKPAPDGPGSLKLQPYSMAMLAQTLSTFAGRGPVEDKTGLTGLYDVSLSWDNGAGPTIETAIHQQLGLRLVPGKVTIQHFWIDSAERPSAN